MAKADAPQGAAGVVVHRAAGGRVLWSDADFRSIEPKYRVLYDVLVAKAPLGRLPGRRHFDPVDVPQFLAWINLVDVVEGGGRRRFRFRLHGTRQTELAGRDVTGLFVEDAVIAPSAWTLGVREEVSIPVGGGLERTLYLWPVN